MLKIENVCMSGPEETVGGRKKKAILKAGAAESDTMLAENPYFRNAKSAFVINQHCMQNVASEDFKRI